MLKTWLTHFWDWYERNYLLTVGVSIGLFLLQLVHLYWLTTHVVALRFLGTDFFPASDLWEPLIILVDYTEIPALLSVSLIYLNELRKQFSRKSIWFLIFLNSQWLHILWITDEFVIQQFAGGEFLLFPIWLAWLAIAIDYLELPVIYDTVQNFFKSFLLRPRV